MSTLDGGLRARVNDADADPVSAARPAWCVLAGALGVALAGTAAAVVLLSDDLRWLRLAVVAALWSALLGVTVVLRRVTAHDTAGRHEAAALRRRYTRELEREVAARRDYEASLAADVRDDVQADVRAEVRAEVAAEHDQELAVLRDEVERLRGQAESASAAMAPPRLRVVGESAPPPEVRGHHGGRGPTLRPAESPALPTSPTPSATSWSSRPTFGRPTPPSPLPSPVAARSERRDGWNAVDRGWSASSGAGDPSDRRPSVHGGSFVDQYVRSTGYVAPDTSSGQASGPSSGPAAAVPPPAPSVVPPPGPEATTGRTVAELLAAHAAPGSVAHDELVRGRRRREG